METFYEELRRTVEGAGFFTDFIADPDGGPHQFVCASKRMPSGSGLTGNSFWVTKWNGKWFLATWGCHYYRIPDAEHVAKLCIQWLTLAPDRTPYDVDGGIIQKFGLIETDETELGLPPLPVYEDGGDQD
jgi:hypothetical protein